MKKTIGEIPLTNKESIKRMEAMQKPWVEIYNKVILKDLARGMSLFYTGKFRNKRVPKYLKARIPVIERHYCEDFGESGLFITTKEINLFKIGTEVIKVPVMRKFKKGIKIRFRRYSKLTTKK